MTKIQRYEIDVDDSEFGSRDVVGVPSVFGDWVKWDDVKDLIKDAEEYRRLKYSECIWPDCGYVPTEPSPTPGCNGPFCPVSRQDKA